MNRRWKNKRVGLALGSGGARGWAHLGVLEVLEEKGIAVDLVAGVSMGAVVGAFLAAGRIASLRELALSLDWNRLRQFFWEISLSRSGLTDGKRLLEETSKLLGVATFEELVVPLRTVATDLANGGEVVLTEGDLLQALRASISIPGLFSPVRLDGRLLVDGGLVNPVPVNVARDMGAQVVIAVDVSQGYELEEKFAGDASDDEPVVPARPLRLPRQKDEEESDGPLQALGQFFDDVEKKMRRVKASWQARETKPDMLDVLVRSVRIMEAQIALARREFEPPDVLIEPQVGGIGTLDFQRAAEAVEAGRAAALHALDS
ncbi:MAG: patatin-like phospholipase family protein [Kiritimatiellia bacterium]|jgi:NTE family protein|nr:patatin-like phospholipase family protein [Kiritimatiellia bacterium]